MIKTIIKGIMNKIKEKINEIVLMECDEIVNQKDG